MAALRPVTSGSWSCPAKPPPKLTLYTASPRSAFFFFLVLCHRQDASRFSDRRQAVQGRFDLAALALTLKRSRVLGSAGAGTVLQGELVIRDAGRIDMNVSPRTSALPGDYFLADRPAGFLDEIGQTVAVFVGVAAVRGVEPDELLEAVAEGVAVGERSERVCVIDQLERTVLDPRDLETDDLGGVVDTVAVGVLADRVEDQVFRVELEHLELVSEPVRVLVVPAGGSGVEVGAIVLDPIELPILVAIDTELGIVEVGVPSIRGRVGRVGP